MERGPVISHDNVSTLDRKTGQFTNDFTTKSSLKLSVRTRREDNIGNRISEQIGKVHRTVPLPELNIFGEFAGIHVIASEEWHRTRSLLKHSE